MNKLKAETFSGNKTDSEWTDIPVSIAQGAESGYPVIIRRGILSRTGEIISRFNPSGVFIITNSTVRNLHGDKPAASLADKGYTPVIIEMGDGERYKNCEEFIRVCGELIKSGANRKSLILAFGGGVTGDMAGFAASTVMRGIPFIQIPTTLVAQTDSSVGSKTGIDTPWGKNLMGAFYHPKAVIIDPDLLYTLPHCEFSAGMAEVVKTAVIRGGDFPEFLEQVPSNLMEIPGIILEEIVTRSVKLKSELVSRDMFEQNVRAYLNLGHTIGHGIEAASGFNGYSHGQAVSIGMAGSLILSEKLGILQDKNLTAKIINLLVRFRLPVKYSNIRADSIMEYMKFDKKRQGGGVRFVLVKEAGSLHIEDIDNRQILLDTLNELAED